MYFFKVFVKKSDVHPSAPFPVFECAPAQFLKKNVYMEMGLFGFNVCRCCTRKCPKPRPRNAKNGMICLT